MLLGQWLNWEMSLCLFEIRQFIEHHFHQHWCPCYLFILMNIWHLYDKPLKLVCHILMYACFTHFKYNAVCLLMTIKYPIKIPHFHFWSKFLGCLEAEIIAIQFHKSYSYALNIYIGVLVTKLSSIGSLICSKVYWLLHIWTYCKMLKCIEQN